MGLRGYGDHRSSWRRDTGRLSPNSPFLFTVSGRNTNGSRGTYRDEVVLRRTGISWLANVRRVRLPYPQMDFSIGTGTRKYCRRKNLTTCIASISAAKLYDLQHDVVCRRPPPVPGRAPKALTVSDIAQVSNRYCKTVPLEAHAMELASRGPPAIAHVDRWNAADCCSPTDYPARQRRNNERSSRVRSNPRSAAGIRASRRFDR